MLLRTKTLIVVLALCVFGYTRNCPKVLRKITPKHIDNVNTVAFVTVTKAVGNNVYQLTYEAYFDVTNTTAPVQFPRFRTIKIECDTVKLDLDADYFLGCKSENSDCQFVRPHNNLTKAEKKTLKIQ